MKSFFLTAVLLFISVVYMQAQVYPRTDTLFIRHTEILPVIDGIADDEAWSHSSWNYIDNVWMPYNNLSSNLTQEGGLRLWEGADDFSGKYKILWSAETNLLYFLAVITDDVFTDGYVYHENPNQGGGYPKYDILEIFIDEDRSGGLHVFDGSGSTGNSWGTNAENAFSYHLAADAPGDGEVQTQFHALDIAGTNWGYPSQKIADYAHHFPEFSMRKEGNVYTWEFSMEVHKDTYNPQDPEASVATLEIGKILGLSMAYCDNDDPTEVPLRRDHFFGSVEVPAGSYNDHWMQADWFGVAKLVTEQPTRTARHELGSKPNLIVSSANNRVIASYSSAARGKVQVRIIDIQGREVLRSAQQKAGFEWKGEFDSSGWPKGIYMLEMMSEGFRNTKKFRVD